MHSTSSPKYLFSFFDMSFSFAKEFLAPKEDFIAYANSLAIVSYLV